MVSVQHVASVMFFVSNTVYNYILVSLIVVKTTPVLKCVIEALVSLESKEEISV